MEHSKEKWLESIGAKAFLEPIKYIYTFPGFPGAFHLSERYLHDTPLEELEKQYAINEKHALRLFD